MKGKCSSKVLERRIIGFPQTMKKKIYISSHHRHISFDSCSIKSITVPQKQNPTININKTKKAKKRKEKIKHKWDRQYIM